MDGEADAFTGAADVLADDEAVGDEAVGACDLAAEPPQLLSAIATAMIAVPAWTEPRTRVMAAPASCEPGIRHPLEVAQIVLVAPTCHLRSPKHKAGYTDGRYPEGNSAHYGRNCLSESNRWPTYYEEDESRPRASRQPHRSCWRGSSFRSCPVPSIAVVSKSVSIACPR